MSESEKPLVWFHGEVRTPPFSRAARVEAGLLLRRLQSGDLLSMPHSRPMPVIGSNCHELRINDSTKSWRLVYFIDSDAIVILDVFDKTTRETPKRIIDVCRKRLREDDHAKRQT